jgi:hypothetical protein
MREDRYERRLFEQLAVREIVQAWRNGGEKETGEIVVVEAL